MRNVVIAALTVLLLGPLAADARGGVGHGAGHAHSSSMSGSHRRTTYATGAQRDGHGKIKRSPAAKAAFKRAHPCPSTGKSSGACPGYVIDHVKALKRGGADDPSNMQWQTREAAKAKDKSRPLTRPSARALGLFRRTGGRQCSIELPLSHHPS